MQFRRKLVWLAVWTIGLSSLFGLVSAEFLFRAYQNSRYRQQFRDLQGPWEMIENDTREFQFKRGIWGTTQLARAGDHSFSFHLNSLGFRGSEWLDEPNTNKILALGDSYTFGWALADHETFPAQLETQLQDVSYAVHVLNAGIPGYNTRQELGLLRQIIQTVQPDLVIVGFVMNDAQPAGFAQVPVSPRVSYEFASSWAFSELIELFKHALRLPVKGSKYVAGRGYLEDFRSDGPGWREVKESLSEIAATCQARNVPVILVVFPDVTQRLDSSYPYRPIHNQVMAAAHESKIPAYDLMRVFDGENSETLRVPWESHPNMEANRQVAAFLTRLIRDGHFLRPRRGNRSEADRSQ
jgi:lysophospholipase L1-like esterase